MSKSRAGAAIALLALLAVVAVVNSRRVHPAPRAAAPIPAPTVSASPRLAGCFASAVRMVDVEFSATAVDSWNHKTLRADSLRCGSLQGDRAPSQVQVVDLSDNQVSAVLIPLAEGAHFYSLDAQGSTASVSGVQIGATITVTYTDWAPGRLLGAMYSRAFTTTDGVSFRAGPANLVARPCDSDSLRLTADTQLASPGPSTSVLQASDSSVLRVVNRSDAPCAIEGYPSVLASTGPTPGTAKSLASLLVARSELRGAAGGVMYGDAPPVILLDPDQGASAALDSSNEAADGGATLCQSVTSVEVGLAAGPVLGSVPIKIRVCDFQTHPWVPGLTGSHP